MLYQLFWLFLAFSFLGSCLEVAATAVRLGQYRDVYKRQVCVLVQNLGDQRNGKAPNNRERSPHQAGTAHPIASGNAAENRFGNVAQERADYKQQKDFVKAAPGSKHLSLIHI